MHNVEAPAKSKICLRWGTAFTRPRPPVATASGVFRNLKRGSPGGTTFQVDIFKCSKFLHNFYIKI